MIIYLVTPMLLEERCQKGGNEMTEKMLEYILGELQELFLLTPSIIPYKNSIETKRMKSQFELGLHSPLRLFISSYIFFNDK